MSNVGALIEVDVDPNWIENIICAVESKPCLYNKADVDYNNRDVKANAWTEICETIVPGWKGMSDLHRKLKGKEVQQRWTNLRHCFQRELREQKKTLPGPAAKRRRKYIYYDRLLFLLPTLEQRETTVSNGQPDEDKDEIAEPTETTELPGDVAKEPLAPITSAACDCNTAPKTSKKRKRYSSDSGTSCEQKLLDILRERVHKTEEIDEDKLFLLSFLPAMRRMSSETKFEAKMEILRIMHMFELGDHS
ncbi:uncharacterized protein LOC101858236 [Aplysia californica]|uniref:Uncharacterized protein LOC101858236 n=1 Tax=Aplysia californica TaxID=6500 RepID=A0ABM0KAE5_APLCA|nr:uncharacterized protein LOC101858236 [Aplysia californica]